MLVEDEPIFLHHLRSAVFWQQKGCEICGEAGDGLSAIEAVQRLQPDIVFMDINLPKLNGLEACEHIFAMADAPRVIVLTAHGEFSFAHKAIKLGVFDYLLKPFDSAELTAALQKCVADIESEKSLLELQEAGEIERYFANLLELEVAGDASFGVLHKKAEFLAVAIKARKMQYEDLPQIRQDIFAACEGIAGLSSYITGIYNGAVVVIHALEDNPGISALQRAYRAMAASSVKQADQYTCVALGDFAQSVADIPKSYKQAVAALENRSQTGGAVVTYQDVKALNSPQGYFKANDVNLLIKLFEAGQNDEADEVIERIFAVSRGQMLSFQYVISVYQSLLVTIYARYQYQGKNTWGNHSAKALVADLSACVTTGEIVGVLKENIHEAFSDCMNLQVPGKTEVLVRKIEKYIKLHYGQESLSVDQIAQALFFENSYVRRVYKTFTNKTIMQHLEETRMERAKQLLEQTDLKNSDIAAEVGYADAFYFSRRFKLYTGFSPSEYRGRAVMWK